MKESGLVTSRSILVARAYAGAVGLITARAGAARADVLRRIESRLPVPVVVVQAAPVTSVTKEPPPTDASVRRGMLGDEEH